jgi:uncharacterized SAM-binding protein YcdF (DUF218 family)
LYVRDYLVIFGAAVQVDGTASGTLKRRIAGALAIGRAMPGCCYLPTGGAGATGHVEADVMAQALIAAGVSEDDILCERAARDTLESIRLCNEILDARGDVRSVVPCTSRYHVPRCGLLLRLSGWSVQIKSMPGDLGFLPWRKLIWYYLKEIAALPYDVILLIIGGRGKSAQ